MLAATKRELREHFTREQLATAVVFRARDFQHGAGLVHGGAGFLAFHVARAGHGLGEGGFARGQGLFRSVHAGGELIGGKTRDAYLPANATVCSTLTHKTERHSI